VKATTIGICTLVDYSIWLKDCQQRYHQWRSHFDGMIKNGEAPKHRDGKFVFEMIKNINVIFWEACEWDKEEEKRETFKGLTI
jgi:hypothetical protein